jgi:hypothetical protein
VRCCPHSRGTQGMIVTEKHKTSLPAAVSRDCECKEAMTDAIDPPTEVGLTGTEPAGRLLMEASPHDVHFGSGARFKLGELIVTLAHCLSLDRVVVSDPTSGEMRVVTRADLTPVSRASASDVRHPNNLEGISEEVLARATERQAVLRPYIASGVLPGREASQLAQQLKTSTRPVRRWLQRYKQRGDLTAFIDVAPGLRQGQRSLDREVEAIIQFAITRKLGSSGNCTVRSVYEVIRGDCPKGRAENEHGRQSGYRARRECG